MRSRIFKIVFIVVLFRNILISYSAKYLKSFKAFNLFSKSPLPYSCSLCNFYLDTREYKYEKALRRLSEATRKGKCDEAIKVESIYTRGESKYVTSSVSNSVSYSHLIQDSVSSNLLGDNWVSSVPVSVTGNGNCLFNAISVYTETKSSLLKSR